jgi:hypothetical protein
MKINNKTPQKKTEEKRSKESLINYLEQEASED